MNDEQKIERKNNENRELNAIETVWRHPIPFGASLLLISLPKTLTRSGKSKFGTLLQMTVCDTLQCWLTLRDFLHFHFRLFLLFRMFFVLFDAPVATPTH